MADGEEYDLIQGKKYRIVTEGGIEVMI